MRLTLCRYPGCRAVCHGGQCDLHRGKTAESSLVRDPFLDSRAWRNLSTLVARLQPLCAECQRQGRVAVGTQRDHVVPRRERPDIALDARNIENLCDQCHARKTRSGK